MAKKDLKVVELSPLLTPADAAQAHQRAIQRAERRIEEREHLRLELKTREYIHTVHGVIDTLRAGKEPLVMEDGSPQWVPLDRVRVQSLKAAGDMALRLLDRVLPPLKAVEINDSPEKQMDPMRLTTSELLKMVGKAGGGVTVDVDYEKTEEPVPPSWLD